VRHTVVHFIESADFGGAERALMYLLNGLDRQQWRPILFYHAADSEMPSWIEEAHHAGIEVRAVPRLEGKWNMPHWPRFFADLRRAGPAVFHAHVTWPLACTEALLLARLARVPVVIATMQLFWDLPYNTGMRLKRRLVAAAVDRYIAVSHENAGQIRATFDLASDKLRVVHNAVDVDLFASSRRSDPSLRAELAGTPDKPIVLTTARLTDQKGHRHLLEAAVQVPEAVFVMAGHGPERDALESQAQRLGISDRVKFLGFRGDIPDLLASCDVFVLPSLYEGLPLALLEAAAVGKPVVATTVGGVGEIVIHDETGLLVSPADPPALAAALRRLLADPDVARRLAAAASMHVRRTFSLEAMVKSVTAIYDQLLAERGLA
jgi:glycosyltransferase involved in cell wall biosynthesis